MMTPGKMRMRLLLTYSLPITWNQLEIYIRWWIERVCDSQLDNMHCLAVKYGKGTSHQTTNQLGMLGLNYFEEQVPLRKLFLSPECFFSDIS